MPVFELQTQDGKKYQVDAPDQETAAKSLTEHTGSSSRTIGEYARAAVEPVTRIPRMASAMAKEAMDLFGRGVEDIKGGNYLKGTAESGMGALGYVGAWPNAAVHSIVGQPIEENTGIPSIITDTAASLALPIPKGIPRLPRAAAPAVAPARMLDVTLSEGQAARELPLVQREQAALRGQSGPPAQKAAQEFTEQQKAELAAAREKIARDMDPFKQRIAESSQETGEIVSQSVAQTAASRKAAVDAAYREARSYPGEVHAKAFAGMAQQIKGDLSLRDEPVIIDAKLTPFASRMIDDLEQRISQLRIENRADPFGQPDAERITGVNLAGIDQMRKRLSTFRKDAFSSGNGADGRAAKAVLDAFDDRIDAAVNGGMFKGDPRAITAWNDARAAYADYRSAFTAGKNDPVGRVVEKIIGKNNNPAAIPNDVADFMFGSAGVNPTSLNAGVVTRVKNLLGERSPEWSAVKQGLFARLTEAGEGMTEMGPGKVAQRINRFLNVDGKEMANLVYSKAERDLIQKYGDLMRHIEIPQAGANWSGTAAFAAQGFKPSMTARALNAIGTNVGSVIGAVVGHFVIPGLPFGAAEAAGAASSKIAGWSGQAMEARRIAKQMPIVSKVAKNFYDAGVAAESSPTPRNIARLTLAAQNLSRNLKDVGVAMSPDNIMRAMQGPAQGSAQQKQQ